MIRFKYFESKDTFRDQLPLLKTGSLTIHLVRNSRPLTMTLDSRIEVNGRDDDVA